MAETQEVPTSDDVLSSFYTKIPNFIPRDWRVTSQSWSSKVEFNPNSTDGEIMKTLQDKEMMLLVPVPGKEVSYDAYKYEWKNPFQALKGMKFIQGSLPFDQIKGMVTLNLTWKWRDVIVLLPNPRSETSDIYIIENTEKPKRTHWGSEVTRDVERILS